ncbi:hypothetical protein [Streptomyces sp. NPDC096339]|uniref:hypothetical protein n=1 Tax=Streptomyces sp. NPDC096339 TaxID=3366086 RepID=UPI003803C74E
MVSLRLTMIRRRRYAACGPVGAVLVAVPDAGGGNGPLYGLIRARRVGQLC